ncbi:MAG: VCBS repeat-containing protein [Bacteroidetes bacterium]|nr:VCBS repeat-containing protein [Bacteroidota bacterium]
MKLNIALAILLIFFSKTLHAQPAIKWTFDTKDASFGQSAAADIDGDGKLEIVFGCYRNDSCVYALNAENGTLLWKFNTHSINNEGCNDVAPIIYDVDGDGKPEVIVASSCNPKTYCFDGKTGAIKWICNTRGSDSPPTIADVDGDGKPEILHGEFGGYVICINAENGTQAWEIAVDTQSWVQTAPTILDINNDGVLDFVVATWNAQNKLNNKVYAFNGKTQQILWTHSLNNVVYHGSAVADLDKDGKAEIIIGCYNDTLYCLNSHDGSVKWTYSVGNNFYIGGPAQIADLDHDGNCEVIFSAWYAVVALKSNGSLLWQYNIPNYGQSFRGAAIADINNDANPDVTFATDNGSVIALNGNNGTLIFNQDLRSHYGNTSFAIDHAPLVADFDNDGKKDVFVVGGHGEYPDFYKDFGRAYMLSVGKGNGPDWLMFQNDIRRQSNICQPLSNAITNTIGHKNDIELFPNPIQDNTICIRLTTQLPTHLLIKLTNLQGKIIDQFQSYLSKTGVQTINWQPKNELTVGLYYCIIQIGVENKVFKLVKQ